MTNTKLEIDFVAAALDRFDYASDPSVGEDMADIILARLAVLGINLPTDAKYLAMGAGQGLAELEMARLLGINTENVTLLDKKFSTRAVARFHDLGFIGTRVEDDAFRFLETPQTQKFDLVSAFSMDYAYNTNDRLEQLIAGLSANMNADGIVVLTPDKKRFGITQTWAKHGFVSLGGGTEGSHMFGMILKNPTETRQATSFTVRGRE